MRQILYISIFLVFISSNVAFSSQNVFECKQKCKSTFSSTSEQKACGTGCSWQFHPNVKGNDQCRQNCSRQFGNKGQKEISACMDGCSK